MQDVIEEKARAAKEGDEDAIRELADAIFATWGAATIPLQFAAAVKERMVRAEISFRRGHRGIREANVTRAFNIAADAFDAPRYARTSRLQLRVFGDGMAQRYPSLFSRQRETVRRGLSRKLVAWVLPVEVSPVQCALLMLGMLQQKEHGRWWAKTWEEFAIAYLWRVAMGPPKPKIRGQQVRSASFVIRPATERQTEMDNVIRRGLIKLGTAGLTDLGNRMVKVLGVGEDR